MPPWMTRSGAWYTRLHYQIAGAMVLGVVFGLTLGPAATGWLGGLGSVFVRLLRMVIVPLVITSIVTGVVSVGSGRNLGRLGLKTLFYYLFTSMAAILVGLVLVNLLHPGASARLTAAPKADLPALETAQGVGDILVRLIPTNPVHAAAEGDMLGIIFFSILLGISLNQVASGPRQRLADLLASGFDVMMVLTSGVIRLVPLGVLGLITRAVASTGLQTFRALGVYMFTVAAGLTIHLMITLPLILLLVGRIHPRIHFRNMADTLLTAFSTSSSSATLPVTMRDVEHRAGVSNKVTSFVLPMGATINMDGTALYECVAVIFICQVLGFGLTLQAQVVVVITALLASIGAAGIPSAGLVMIFIITDAINLRGPEVATIVGMLLAIDRPLDMYRTMVNVFSDSCGAAIIARSEGESTVDAA
ncbi:MAG: dicarboxylate/amino acid:cation symporter [Acidobacteriota bacterium]